MVELLVPLAASLIGGLGSLFGSNDKDNKLNDLLKQLQSMMPELQKGAFTKDELLQYGNDAKKAYATSGDVAAAGLAPSISERNMSAGVPEGQPSNSMYVSELAPIKAQGIQMGEQNFTNILQLIEQMDSQSKSRALSALTTQLGSINSQDDMNTFGKTLSGVLQGGNLGMTALGNYGQYSYWKNKQTVDIPG